MSALLKELLSDDRATLAQVLDVINVGVDPMYEDGNVLLDALRKFGYKTLGWYDARSSVRFLEKRTRAMKMANVILYRREYHGDSQSGSIMSHRDGRLNKAHSVAHLYILRTCLVRDWADLALKIVQNVSFPIGILLDAIDADHALVRKTLTDYRQVENTAYVRVLRGLPCILDEKDVAVLDAFITLKIAVEESSITETAAALWSSRDPFDYVMVGEYSHEWEMMISYVMKKGLAQQFNSGTLSRGNALQRMYSNIGLFKETAWPALQESLKSIAREKGMMTEEAIGKVVSDVDLKRVHDLSKYQKVLLGRLEAAYMTAKLGDSFDTEEEVSRPVEVLESVEVPQLDNEDDTDSVAAVKDKAIEAVKRRYAHWV